MARRFLIIAGFAESLLAFRGELLATLIASGVEVHAAAPEIDVASTTRFQLMQMGVHLHDIPGRRAGMNPFSDLRLLWRLYVLMRRFRPDWVLGYTIKPVIYGSIAAWLASVPRRFALITGLGYAFTNGRAGALHNIVCRLYTLALARVDKVFFQNSDDMALFRDRRIVPESVPSVVVNGSGVDLRHFYSSPLPIGEVRFLMVCRLLGDKGVREYLMAARRIRAEHPGVCFALAGWIDENPDAITRAELDEWIAEGSIEYLGRLTDVRAALSNCTVYVLPSYREGTPRTVLEAMAMGRSIITTDAPGCRETVVEGLNGFLVPAKSVDALVHVMQEVLADPSILPKMGQESRRLAESKYDVHKVNETMLREMGLLSPQMTEELCGE